MARWMKEHTAAATSPKDRSGEHHIDQVWSKERHRYHQRDLFLWGVGVGVTLMMVVLFAPQLSPSSKHTITQSQLSPLPEVEGLSGDEPDSQSDLTPPEHQVKDDESTLIWWVDRGLLPSKASLVTCLSHPRQAPIEVLDGEGGYTIITPGRTQPQTLYLRQRQLWFKTPKLSSAHVQAYDHLALASCLKVPQATLYDPMLVRQWGADEWPRKNPESGGFPLDDLFVIRSSETAHYTYGLSRVGLPELGVLSASSEAREALRHIALAWLVIPQSRARLKTQLSEIVVKGVPLEMRDAQKIDVWLGPLEVKIATGPEGVLLDDRTLTSLSRAQVPKSKTKRADRKRNKNKKRRRKYKEMKGVDPKIAPNKRDHQGGLLQYQ